MKYDQANLKLALKASHKFLSSPNYGCVMRKIISTDCLADKNDFTFPSISKI